jgi:hypothetical protein
MKKLSKKQIRDIFTNSLEEMKIILPLFFIATLVGVLLEIYVPDQIISNLQGEDLFLAIPLAAVIGVLLPLPRYATYPIAFSLFKEGASIGVIFALISGEVILGSPDRDVMELKYFGLKSFFLRLILCIVFVIAGAFLIEILL